jgi:hypothetical protein
MPVDVGYARTDGDARTAASRRGGRVLAASAINIWKIESVRN